MEEGWAVSIESKLKTVMAVRFGYLTLQNKINHMNYKSWVSIQPATAK